MQKCGELSQFFESFLILATTGDLVVRPAKGM